MSMLMTLGGQLSKAKYKELLKALPARYTQNISPEEFLKRFCNNTYYPEQVVVHASTFKACMKVIDFCRANQVAYQYQDYTIKVYIPGQIDAEGNSNLSKHELVAYYECMEAWKTLEDVPPYLNDGDINVERCAKYVLRVGRIDTYELFKEWFRVLLPLTFPKFEWTT